MPSEAIEVCHDTRIAVFCDGLCYRWTIWSQSLQIRDSPQAAAAQAAVATVSDDPFDDFDALVGFQSSSWAPLSKDPLLQT